MQLKNYQQTALDQLERWLEAVKLAHKDAADAAEFYAKKGGAIPSAMANYPANAWESMKNNGAIPAISKDGEMIVPEYISRTAACGDPIPHVCLKVPTGGGKTLLGVAALERVKQDTGFVLWIVPTRAIYEQTIDAFKTREHPYRQLLERISGSKVKLLQKTDRFTDQDVENYLCVMMLMLPSANRQKNKDFLKIFRDSGGYVSFFPQQDNVVDNRQFVEDHADLETHANGLVKHSLINTLKLIRPTVILDEAHRAYGKKDAANREFVNSVNRLNPHLVLELSATPKIGISNILVNVSGVDLQTEEMIKLPIEIYIKKSDWQNTLAAAHEKLAELDAHAQATQARENRHVRPIALVRVQRTGKEQRKAGVIHAEDARQYLIKNLAVPEHAIRIQSSEQKQLAGEDLLSEQSHVRWIITKDALKEGWDCSFAYVLALLDNTKAATAMTQMVGRVMRQPHARVIEKQDALNRCYIYCYNEDVSKAVDGVKQGLENEGLTGLGHLVHGHGGGDAPKKITVMPRKKYQKPKIFLPQVLHADGEKWRLIDYDRDILSALDWDKIDGGDAVNLGAQNTRETKITVDIQGQRNGIESEILDSDEALSPDYFVRRLIDIMPNPWQAARVVLAFIQKHRHYDNAKLRNNRMYLSEMLRDRVKNAIDEMAEKVFRNKVREHQIRFHLKTDAKLDYQLNKSFDVSVASGERSLEASHGAPLQKSLFEKVYESDFNDLEKGVALYLDGNDAIHWWHRIAARRGYSFQGWKRHRVYPDFVACRNVDGKLLILEMKGAHLQGNADTHYKRELLETLEATYRTAPAPKGLQIKEPPAQFRVVPEGNWREEIERFVGGD